jgi:hypothetical protein
MKHTKKPKIKLAMPGIDPNVWEIIKVSCLDPDKEKYTITIEKILEPDYEGGLTW